MATVLDLVTDALTEIAAYSPGQTLPYEATEQARRRLNQFLNTCAAENLSIFAVTRTVSPIVPSQASYTIGTGGNINIPRPVFIEHIAFQDSSPTIPTEYPLGGPLTEDAWAGIVLKSMTSPFPSSAYYSPTFPTGTLYPWPIPTSSTLSWVIYHWAAVSEFATLATTVSLPPSYEEFLVTNLALLLAPSYEKQPHPVLVQRARETKAVLMRANVRMRDLSFDAGALIGNARGRMNIYQGP
jgi:hypothetical protein